MRYNLSIVVNVEDGKDPEAKDIFDALERALDSAAKDPKPFLGALTEDKSHSDFWLIVDKLTGIPLEDQPKKDSILRDIDLPGGSVWCHKDFSGTPPILGEIHTDDSNQLGDRIVHRDVDIRPFLAQATAGDIESLHVEDWSYSQSADDVAYFLEGAGDPSAERLFAYLSMNPTGFGVSLDGSEALAWIEENKTDLFREIKDSILDDYGIEP